MKTRAQSCKTRHSCRRHSDPQAWLIGAVQHLAGKNPNDTGVPGQTRRSPRRHGRVTRRLSDPTGVPGYPRGPAPEWEVSSGHLTSGAVLALAAVSTSAYVCV